MLKYSMDNSLSYNAIVKEHLLLSIRKILQSIENNEITDFSISITFDGNFPDNEIDLDSDEVTIILEKGSFSNLNIDDFGFEVDMSIKNKKQTIFVCYDSILIFSDSKSDFVLDFSEIYEVEEEIEKNEVIFVELP